MNREKVEWGVIAFVFVMVLAGMYMAATDKLLFEGWYVVEDGLIEWMTVGALLTGAGICIRRAIRLKSQKPLWFIICTCILAAIFIFGAGEEISWGQRIFNIESSEFFKQHNSQAETNIHNLIVKGKKINKLVFGLMLGIFVALYLLFLPILYRKVTFFKNFVSNFAMPIAKWKHVICYLILFGLVSVTPSGKKGELLEFGSCFLFLLITWNPHNRDLYNE